MPQLLSLHSRACEPQLLSPYTAATKSACLEPMLCNKRSHHNGNLHIATKSSPCSPQPEEAQAHKQRPSTAKNYDSPDSLVGREVWGRVDTCICMAESLCCSLETITTLFVNWLYSNIKLKALKEKKYLRTQTFGEMETTRRIQAVSLIQYSFYQLKNFSELPRPCEARTLVREEDGSLPGLRYGGEHCTP